MGWENHNKKRIFNISDDLDMYDLDDWRDVSENTLPRDVLIKYYKKIDWMWYAMHTDVNALNLPQDILYYIHDDMNKGTKIRETFDKIL